MEVTRSAGYTAETIHMHDHEEIVLITSRARCTVINNGNTIELETPAVFHNRAGSFHEVVSVEEGCYESHIVFFHAQVLADVPSGLQYGVQLLQGDFTALPLTPAQVQDFLPLMELLKARPMPQKLLFLLALLQQMEQVLSEGTKPLRANAHQTYIFDVLQVIREEVAENHTIPELAERFHVSQTKLKADFKRITGLTVNEFTRVSRLHKAKALLETTKMEQSQIAYTCGFADESYLISSFRKTYGITPGAYRRQYEQACKRRKETENGEQ